MALVSNLLARFQETEWDVCLKTMMVTHRLTVEGDERFFKELMRQWHKLPRKNFEMMERFSSFARTYDQYLSEKINVYEHTGVCCERLEENKGSEWVNTLTIEKLVAHAPRLQSQFEALVGIQV